MLELNEIIKVINELIETCRSNNFCHTCPYWNKEKGECRIHMEANVESPPEMW